MRSDFADAISQCASAAGFNESTVGVQLLKDHADIGRDVFTPQQVRALLNAAKPKIGRAQLSQAISPGCVCVVRAELRWKNVDLNAGLLRVKTIKTGQVVTIPSRRICVVEKANSRSWQSATLSCAD